MATRHVVVRVERTQMAELILAVDDADPRFREAIRPSLGAYPPPPDLLKVPEVADSVSALCIDGQWDSHRCVAVGMWAATDDEVASMDGEPISLLPVEQARQEGTVPQ